ncbi:hypothetical protein BH09MYX1_BH09MYX1_58370 [soil metagenome]
MDLPRDESLKFLISRYAGLLARHGDAFEGVELVTPSNEHFPDAFERDAESVLRLVQRMASYAPLDDELDLEIGFFEPDDVGGGKSCSSGACSPSDNAKVRVDGVEPTKLGYRIPINVADTGHPTTLTTALARSVGAMVLEEAEEKYSKKDLGAMSEIAAAACGLGPLLFAGSHLYRKGCSGANVQVGTALDVSETAVMVALTCAVNRWKTRAVRTHLAPTQAELFDEAVAWVDSNDHLVDMLRTTPEALEDGTMDLRPVRSFFGRLFGKKKESATELTAPPSLKTSRRP